RGPPHPRCRRRRRGCAGGGRLRPLRGGRPTDAARPRLRGAAMSTPRGEAALYQRLRGHLDFLKLPAAAEALPGILDAARSQDASTVTVLEQLLAVEVETTHARRLASR